MSTPDANTSYLAHAEALLLAIELQVDALNEGSDVDIDAQRVGAMVTLVFRNRTQIVINLQKPLLEVWMAAKSGGYHYQWLNGVWWSARDGTEFFADLSRDMTAQSGQAVIMSG